MQVWVTEFGIGICVSCKGNNYRSCDAMFVRVTGTWSADMTVQFFDDVIKFWNVPITQKNMQKIQNLPRKCKNDSSKIIIIFFRDTWTTCFGNRQLLSKLSITIQILLHQLHVQILTSIVIVHGWFELYTTNLRTVISWVGCGNGFTMVKKQFDGCLCQPTKTEK